MKLRCLLVTLFLVGCGPHYPPPAHPLSGTGRIQTADWATIDGKPYVEVVYSDDGQIVDYMLCDDSQQPFMAQQTVNLSFRWDERKGCYYVVDSYLVKGAK